MSENKNDTIKGIDDLLVYAMGQSPVGISRERQVSSTSRVKLKVSVDSKTGEVSF